MPKPLDLWISQGEVNRKDASVIISSIWENVQGTCVFNSGETCAATSEFEVLVTNETGEVNYLWEVDEDSTIVSGQGTSNITVEHVSGNVTSAIVIKCTVEDDDSSAFTAETTFYQTRTMSIHQHIISGYVDVDGVTVICNMSESTTHTYDHTKGYVAEDGTYVVSNNGSNVVADNGDLVITD